ncbi:hypothetical protein B4Q13_15215, partial [Lacticaseibacillus rhamnosus]
MRWTSSVDTSLPAARARPRRRRADGAALSRARRGGPRRGRQPHGRRQREGPHAVRLVLDHVGSLAASQLGEAAEILEFQIALLEDEALSAPAFAEIDAGAAAMPAWARAIDAQIDDYTGAEDSYFRDRASDRV